jgi:hypothetical protein
MQRDLQRHDLRQETSESTLTTLIEVWATIPGMSITTLEVKRNTVKLLEEQKRNYGTKGADETI